MFWNNHSVEKSALQDIQVTEHLRRLAMPGDTRWGSLFACFTSMAQNREVLRDIVSTPGWTEKVPKQVRLKFKYDNFPDNYFV